MQIADCVYSGKAIYPLFSLVYLKKKSRWNTDSKFKSIIELQKYHLMKLVEMNLRFSCVLRNKWYFSKDLVNYIYSLGKDWIAQVKLNRRVKSERRWKYLNQFVKNMINTVKFKVIYLGEDCYLMKVFTVKMKGRGLVKILVSVDKNGNSNVYVTNRLDWDEIMIAAKYSRRWDIKVWHR